MVKTKLLGILIIAAVAGGLYLLVQSARDGGAKFNYEVVSPFRYKISLFDSIPQVVRIRITPDGETMLVGTLAENIYAYRKVNGEFVRQEKPFFDPKTGLPGFPPEESGLSGIAFGVGF